MEGRPLAAPSSKSGGSWVPQYLATVSGTLCVFCGGTAIAWSSPAVPMLKAGTLGVPLTEDEASWVSSLLAAGALLGSIPAGPVADLVGRKRALLSQGILFALSWLMIFVAKSAHVLYLARLISGIAVGASTSLAPLYTSEIAEESLKGSLCSFTQLMIVSGVLYSYVVGALCSYHLTALLCGAVPLVFLVLFSTAPESPVYLLSKGRDGEARDSLSSLRGRGKDVLGELGEMKRSAAATGGGGPVWRRSNLRGAWLCVSLMVFQQLSGINTVVFNSTEVFAAAAAGSGGLSAPLSTVLLGAAQAAATLTASLLLLPFVQRRRLLAVSSFLMAASLLATGTYLNLLPSHLPYFPLFTLLLYIVSFSIGFGPVPYVLLGELLAPDVKPLVSGLSVASNWISAFLVVESYPYLVDGVGPDRTFWLYGILCLLVSLFVVAFVPETKDKDIETIQEELEVGHPSGYQRI